jgi:protein SCO1/2
MCLLIFWDLLLVALLLTPASETGVGALAQELRVWCFGLDPATGSVEWAFVLSMLTPPLMVGGMLLAFWWQPLRQMLARPVTVIPHALTAALLVGFAGGALALVGAGNSAVDMAFPADALRTALPPPQLSLVNQAEQTVDLAALRGKVVLLTGVYASCPHTCPLILAQTKRAIAELSEAERADLRVVAVTMDPANDSPEVLAALGSAQKMALPLYQFATGEVSEVERILDDMGIARERDPETGVISHVNLFLLLDRSGKLAYRLGLGENQERWLVSALRLLLRESTAPHTASRS